MSGTIKGPGPTVQSLGRDKDGYRTYKVSHQVETSNILDGPQVVMNTPGLPSIGSVWSFGNDLDMWVTCLPTMAVKPRIKKETCTLWDVDQIFSNKPDDGGLGGSCLDEEIEDPLLIPQRVSGSFIKERKIAEFDRNGTPLVSSSWEPLHYEFDDSRPTVRIEQNVASLGLSAISSMINTVNSSPMWGLGARRIKLSNISWERKVWGSCDFYYTRAFEFEVNYDTFDPLAVDRGFMALNGSIVDGAWVTKATGAGGTDPDPNNPLHFVRIDDIKGNKSPKEYYLNAGLPQASIATADTKTLEYYSESNFFLLGVPTSF